MDTPADTGMDLGALNAAVTSYNQQQAPAPQAPAAAPETQQQQPTETQQTDAPTPEAPKTEDTSNKKPWERLKGEEVEKAAEETTKPEETEVKPEETKPEEPPGQMSKLQKDAWNKLAHESREYKRQLKAAEAKLKELSAKPVEFKVDEATQKELEELRTYRAANDIRTTPEFNAAVIEPVDAVLANLKGMAEYAKVDFDALADAAEKATSWERALAVKNVFAAAEEPVPQEIVSQALLEAEKLPPLYAKGMELEKKAQEVWSGIQNKSEAQRQQEQAAKEKAFTESRGKLFEQVKTKFPSIFKDEKVAKEVGEATLSDDPDDRAYAAIAAYTLPHLSQQIIDLKAEIAKLKASEATLLKGRPNVGKAPENVGKKDDDSTELDIGALQSVVARHIGR